MGRSSYGYFIHTIHIKIRSWYEYVIHTLYIKIRSSYEYFIHTLHTNLSPCELWGIRKPCMRTKKRSYTHLSGEVGLKLNVRLQFL